MERRPDKYVQEDRIWNPIEEKWEIRNRVRYIEEDSFQEGFGGKREDRGQSMKEKGGKLSERNEGASVRRPASAASGNRAGKAAPRQSGQNRGTSNASQRDSAGIWKVIRNVIIGVVFFVVFGNLLVGILSMLMFGVLGL